MASTAYVAAAGSPGPLLKNTPSGEAARICSAVAMAGTTRTSQPRAARFRGVDALIPRSTATTRYLAGPGGLMVYGSGVLTTRARSAPVISGLASTRSSSRPGSLSTVLIAARMAPARAPAWSATWCRGPRYRLRPPPGDRCPGRGWPAS